MKTTLKLAICLTFILLISCSKKTDVTPKTTDPIVTGPKNYLPTGWKELAKYAGTENMAGNTLVAGNKIYSGLGYSGAAGLINVTDKWFEYDPTANTWAEKAMFPGGGRANAVAFSINGKIYAGLGTNYNRSTKADVYGDFYEFDPAANKWTKKADFPGEGRDQPAFFSIGDKGYMGTGNTMPASSFSVTRDFWMYDTVADKWTKMADMPANTRCRAFGFAVNGKGYLGGGEDSQVNKLNDFYEYDPANNKWKQLRSMPISVSRPRGIADAAAGYLVGGLTGQGASESNVKGTLKYDALTDAWTDLGDLASDHDYEKGRLYSMASILNGKLYFGAGGFKVGDQITNKADFYEFTLK